MAQASFELKNKLEKTQFFQETFLIVNTNVALILRIPFLTLINADILFVEQTLT